jgi:3-oxoacyl-[acyl-carrier protein] reductase
MELGLAGATVCVQGGSKGIGRAAAECFAAEGAKVAVLARDAAIVNDAVEQLAASGSPDAFGVSADMSDAGSIEKAFGEISRRWDELNVLLCAVGPPVSNLPWHAVTDDQFVEAFTLGALAPVRCARAALPMFRKAEWARIVNISAMSSRCHGPGLIDYTAAKSALTSITKNLSVELGGEGILANTVSPGTVITNQLSDYIAALPAELGISADDPVSVMKHITESFDVRADLGRAGLPHELAGVICYLASRSNTLITGANVNVDAGSSFFA